eukprot:TRINITY_DN0_c0_g1_i3.p1 TRINITY_DN0_c0_g1~~TRINITY_DN0_c0_g1_i3.p1  ORF type:complete len:203 (-),score=1.44 TRINITY_DN0_c0_g1_i3:215-823(-)
MQFRLCFIFLLAAFSLGLRLRKKARWTKGELRTKYFKLTPMISLWEPNRITRNTGDRTIPVLDITGTTLNSNECFCTAFSIGLCLCMQSNGNLVLYRGSIQNVFGRLNYHWLDLDIVSGACWNWIDSDSYQFSVTSTSVKITKDGSACWAPELSGTSGRLLMGEKALYWNYKVFYDHIYWGEEYPYKNLFYKYEFQSLTHSL